MASNKKFIPHSPGSQKSKIKVSPGPHCLGRHSTFSFSQRPLACLVATLLHSPPIRSHCLLLFRLCQIDLCLTLIKNTLLDLGPNLIIQDDVLISRSLTKVKYDNIHRFQGSSQGHGQRATHHSLSSYILFQTVPIPPSCMCGVHVPSLGT